MEPDEVSGMGTLISLRTRGPQGGRFMPPPGVERGRHFWMFAPEKLWCWCL